MSTSVSTAASAKVRSNENYIRARARRRAFYGWVFLAPFTFLFTIVFIIPILVSVYRSFFQLVSAGEECGPYGCEGGQQEVFVGLENFKLVITNGPFWVGMGRIFLFGIVQIPIMIFIALALALLLDSLAARFKGLYRLCYFLPYAIPGVIASIVWIYLYSPELSPIMAVFKFFGISPNLFSHSDVLWSMANVTTWTYVGYNMLIFYAALQSVPAELYEAARIDGASELMIARRIKIPMLSSAALLTILLSIIGTIQLFNEPKMFQKVAELPVDYMPMMFALHIKSNEATIAGVSGAGMAAAVSIVMAVVAGILALCYAMIQRKVAPTDE